MRKNNRQHSATNKEVEIEGVQFRAQREPVRTFERSQLLIGDTIDKNGRHEAEADEPRGGDRRAEAPGGQDQGEAGRGRGGGQGQHDDSCWCQRPVGRQEDANWGVHRGICATQDGVAVFGQVG